MFYVCMYLSVMYVLTCSQARLVLDNTEKVSLGQLWLELLRFYTLEFALEDYIISIRLNELLPRDVKNWPRRRLAIEGEARTRFSLTTG